MLLTLYSFAICGAYLTSFAKSFVITVHDNGILDKLGSVELASRPKA